MSGLFGNLTARNKILAQSCAFVLFAALTAFAAYRFTTINTDYSADVKQAASGASCIIEISECFNEIELSLRDVIINSGDTRVVNDSVGNIESKFDSLVNLVNRFVGYDFKSIGLPASYQDKADSDIQGYKTLIDKILSASDDTGYMESLLGESVSLRKGLLENLNSGHELLMSAINSKFADNMRELRQLLCLAAGVSAALMLVLISMAASSSTSTAKALKKLSAGVKSVAEGDLGADLVLDRRDETGLLSRDVAAMVSVFASFAECLNKLSAEFKDGNTKTRLDIGKFSGDYKKIAANINTMISTLTDECLYAAEAINSFCEGNLNFDSSFGKRNTLTSAVTSMQNNLRNISRNVRGLADAVKNGRLDETADMTKLKGSWSDIVEDINGILKSVSRPIDESIKSLREIEKGNINVLMNGDYKGRYAELKDAINCTRASLSKYINELAEARLLNEKLSQRASLTTDQAANPSRLETTTKPAAGFTKPPTAKPASSIVKPPTAKPASSITKPPTAKPASSITKPPTAKPASSITKPPTAKPAVSVSQPSVNERNYSSKLTNSRGPGAFDSPEFGKY